MFQFLVLSFVSQLYFIAASSDPPPMCDPGEEYLVQHNAFCDRFYACRDGKAHLFQCEDGFAYAPCRGCRILHRVDCSARPLLQPPKATRDCPRLNGIFPDSKGCGHYVKCVNGMASFEKCSSGLMYDDKFKSCREGTAEELTQCKTPAFLGCDKGPDGQYSSCYWYRCPVQNELMKPGESTLHPFPGNCRFYIICGKGGDVQIGRCSDTQAFNPASRLCEEETVATCRPKQDPRVSKLF